MVSSYAQEGPKNACRDKSKIMERFSSLRYKVHQSSNLEKDFPDLFKHQEFKKILRKRTGDKIIRYIIFLYDKKSDLVQEFQTDLSSRKDAAAVEAGLERRMGKWTPDIQDIMDVTDRDAYEAILLYLKLQNSVLWKEIIVTEQELEEFQKLRFMSIDTGDKKKNKRSKNDDGDYENTSVNVGKNDKDIYEAAKKKDTLMKACDDRIKYLEVKRKEFFGDNSDVMVAEFAEVITPELAEKIIKKENIGYEVTC